MFVYMIINDVTKKYYIGQHKGNNLKKYLQTKLSDAKHYLSKRSHLYAAMRKHPKETWRIHSLVSTLTTKAQLDEWETFFIALFRSRDPAVGYNICRGGEGFTGPQSESAKKLIAAAAKKAWDDPVRRKKMQNGWSYARTFRGKDSAETKAKRVASILKTRECTGWSMSKSAIKARKRRIRIKEGKGLWKHSSDNVERFRQAKLAWWAEKKLQNPKV